jgi:hypothetical protein
LPANLQFPLSSLTLTPYMPVPETNGEEWDRLEPATALDVLVELAIHGEYNGLEGAKRTKDGLELRTAAVVVFEVKVSYRDAFRFSTGGRRILFVRRKLGKLSYKPCSRSKAQVLSPCFYEIFEILTCVKDPHQY